MSDSHSYVPTAEVSSFNRNLDLIRAPLYSITSSDRLIPQCSRLNSAFGMKLIHDMVHERCDKRNPPTIMNRFSIFDDELGTYNSIRESFLRSETRSRAESQRQLSGDSDPGMDVQKDPQLQLEGRCAPILSRPTGEDPRGNDQEIHNRGRSHNRLHCRGDR